MKTSRPGYAACWLSGLLLLSAAQAQPIRSDSIFQKNHLMSSYAEATIEYSSNSVFAGRTDTAKLPYLGPTARYFHRSGLFAESSLSLLTSGNEIRIDVLALSAGYRYSKRNFMVSAYATKYFFNDRSVNVKSEISGFGAISTGFSLADVINIYSDMAITFSSKADIIIGLEANHQFYMIQDHLTLSPTVYANFGTQNYYTEYTEAIRSGRHGNRTSGNLGTGTAVRIVETSGFELLDYEFSLPVKYSLKRLSLFFSPVYAVPVNASSFPVDGGFIAEKLKNTFYWSAGLTYKIVWKVKRMKNLHDQ
jgi:hypothetical protein